MTFRAIETERITTPVVAGDDDVAGNDRDTAAVNRDVDDRGINTDLHVIVELPASHLHRPLKPADIADIEPVELMYARLDEEAGFFD
jgi:hypothetical protein